MKKNAFTLIELLVVISIIGILAALATVSFTGSQKQARDTGRKADLKGFQTMLEVFANKNNGFYPAYIVQGMNVDSFCSSLSISPCPNDPKAGIDGWPSYGYISDGGRSDNYPSATQYVLWARLENVPSETVTYWMVCSTGHSGKNTTSLADLTGGVCPIAKWVD